MRESTHIVKAKRLIEAVHGKPLSLSERKRRAIDLAALMLAETRRIQTRSERRQQKQLARMMNDRKGKAFTTCMTDECFRSQSSRRVANQLVFILKKYGIPRYLSLGRRLQLWLFQFLGKPLAWMLIPIVKRMVRQETSSVILPAESKELVKHMQIRREAGVRINLNHLGEAILGEGEAERRLKIYLDDLARPEVEYISIKISTVCSQINLCGREETLHILSERLRQLYRAAERHQFRAPDGQMVPKFVNLDMEEYRDLHLTIALFCRVLDEPEFRNHRAGIVLQAYLPDAFRLQQDLTEWAMRRVAAGGAPIKIRIVKGANLAMEQVEASLHDWPQAPYTSKLEVDANYKRMVLYGSLTEHAKAASLGIASHNLFDIAFALLLRAENQIENEMGFEMLEGMADPMRRVVQALSGHMLLYCPTATAEEFQNAVAYLIRRLDENTAPQNFLRHAFSLVPGSNAWEEQKLFFEQACDSIETVSATPRRVQDRTRPPERRNDLGPFRNEPDTDWALPANGLWIHDILRRWKGHTIPLIPLVINGAEVRSTSCRAMDPSAPDKEIYSYTLASLTHVDQALRCAKTNEPQWAAVNSNERARLLSEIAHVFRKYRGDLIGAMVISCGKTAFEADVEVSEAIDFAEYYLRNWLELQNMEDVRFGPKGTVLVAPPWNFPTSIPAGGILAGLVTGNCVIFKPAREAVLVGWLLIQLFWEAGISKNVLQFFTCDDDVVGSALVKDPRLNTVILTGSTATAKSLLRLRPGLDLLAETGGKNSLIVTAMADRDLAVRDLVQSAFGYAGQKCSACSLGILEAEVYDDLHFRQQLRDAASSWVVGPSWNLSSKLTPLIRPPEENLKRALTTLEPGEEWLLQPKVDPHNPHLWSPGIKLGVREGSFTHCTEFFGPLLGLMRADNLAHAVRLANAVPYGLTAGIHTLDEREQRDWIQKIEAGNCYINRSITGAIVQRQPFGGCKESSFGRGAKAGGPNYLLQLLHAEQRGLPGHLDEITPSVKALDKQVRLQGFATDQLALWTRSIGSYAFYWNHYFSQKQDPSPVLGQDNLFYYRPQPLLLRVQTTDAPLDVYRAIAAAMTCGTLLEVSGETGLVRRFMGDFQEKTLNLQEESEEQLIARLKQMAVPRIRLLSPPSRRLQIALADLSARILAAPVMINGRLELLNYLREVSLSIDYHRYGHLGLREGDTQPLETCPIAPCEGCTCSR